LEFSDAADSLATPPVVMLVDGLLMYRVPTIATPTAPARTTAANAMMTATGDIRGLGAVLRTAGT
jgi:hypothetical protein